MATVSKGRQFVSGEIITPAKLNDVVDLATVTDIQTADIADGQITTAKILDGNVTDAKLATGIDASKLTTGTLPIARIADGAVTNDKLSLAANAGEIKKALNADNAPPIFACRAWVNFDGTTTPPTIRASGNVSSVARNSAGVFVVNLMTALPDADYSWVGSGQASSATNAITIVSGPPLGANVPTTTTLQINTVNVAGTFFNPLIVSIQIFR